MSRSYQAFTTKFNVHFNANEAYKESLKQKKDAETNAEILSKFLFIYPDNSDTTDIKVRGSFDITIDKTTKAIKLHSIKTKPRKNPKKRNDKEYQAWIRQQEFNPYLVNSWMLLAKSELEEANYLRAITTFMYITKIYEPRPEVVTEARLHIARAYLEMGWYYEAENVLKKLEQDGQISNHFLGLYNSLRAQIALSEKRYSDALPYLQASIKSEKNKVDKIRKKYLLAQIYENQGNKELATQAYGTIKGLSTPYIYTFNADLKKLALSNNLPEKNIASLKRMAKKSLNDEYLDQIYFEIGNIYLNTPDTLKAIENYEKAVKESTRNGYEKALAQIRVGGIYFEQQGYIKAQPHYSDALQILSKRDEQYPLVSLRSEVLDQLVVHAKVFYEQDSLLTLVAMPEADRIKVIEKHIEELKKEEARKEREKKENLQERAPIQWGNHNANESTNTAQQKKKEPDFYFYNKQTVEQGKLAFQNQWGRRSLEDGWRLSNKERLASFDDEDIEDIENELAEDTENAEEKKTEEGKVESKEKETDIYSVEYYLQQLPLSEKAQEESHKLRESAMFNMALIYKNLLGDADLASTTFLAVLSDYPESPNKEEIYYNLFLLYLQTQDRTNMLAYRSLLISEFPESKYTIPLQQENFEWNFTHMASMQEALYQETYDAYVANDIQLVRANYEKISKSFPFVDLMPKFTLLYALSYAQERDAKGLKENLENLVKTYPQSEPVPLAQDILERIKDGKILLADGSIIGGINWNMAYASDSIAGSEGTKVIEYVADLDVPYILLLAFEADKVDRNKMLYEVADYNFSNYVVQTFDLNYTTDNNSGISYLEIKGFRSYNQILSYLEKGKETVFAQLEANILTIPISTHNYQDILPRLGMEQYAEFYTTNYEKLEYPEIDLPEKKLVEEFIANVEPPKVEIKPLEQVEIDIDEKKITPSKIAVTQKEDSTKASDNEIADELIDEWGEKIENVNEKLDKFLEDISSNPVEGIKNLFKKDKFEENLTKEEKAELKKEQKELRAKQRAHSDSLQLIIKLRQDSIDLIEKNRQDSISNVKKIEQQQLLDIQKQKEQEANLKKEEAKQKEESKKAEQKARQDARKVKEQEQKERAKQKEDERKTKQKEQERKRKEREAEQKKIAKQKEEERKARTRAKSKKDAK